MGRRGPPPKPTAVLKARGSWRAKLPKNEPKSQAVTRPDDLKAPTWLVGAAKKHWLSLVELLAAQRILTRGDGEALARYCRIRQRWLAMEDWLDDNGQTATMTAGDGNTTEYIAPQAKLASNLADALLRIEQQYGMTPSARTRVEALPDQTKSAKTRFFA